MPQYANPLLEMEWSTYNIEDLASKKFNRKEALHNGKDFSIFFGGPEQQDPTNPSEIYLLDNEHYDNLHERFIASYFSYTDTNKNKKYDDKIDKYKGKLLQLYLFISTDGAWLLDMSKKLETVHDNDLVVFLEVTNEKTKDKVSGNVLICKGGKNAAAYYNEPAIANWYGTFSNIKKEAVQSLVKSCADVETFKNTLRVSVSTMGAIVSWAPTNVGKIFCEIGELIEKLRINETSWNKDSPEILLDYIDSMEAALMSKLVLPDNGMLFDPMLKKIQFEVKVFFAELRLFVKAANIALEITFAFIAGIINGFVDLIAGLFIFIGWILKFIGGAIVGAATFIGDADYYIALATEYADNFIQGLQNLNWTEIFETMKLKLVELYLSIDLSKLFENVSINGREISYYIGYIAINIAACFIGLGEISLFVKTSKPGVAIAKLFDYIAETVGKLPTGLKLTLENIFLVLKKYISLIAEGTKSIIELINKIFEAVLKWILVVTGKIARVAFLLVLASGKRLACSIIPLEELLILFGRVISARIKSNLARLGVTVLENEGRYFVRYGEEVIFSGDREAVERFIGEKLENEESKVKIFLDELVEKVKGLAKIRKIYDVGKKKNVAFSKGEIGGKQINFESVSGGEKAPWTQKGNFEPPLPENYHFKGGPESKAYHTEQKIFEHIYQLFKNNKNVVGKIDIVTDLKFCNNCDWIIEQFKKEFKNIEIVKTFIKEKL